MRTSEVIDLHMMEAYSRLKIAQSGSSPPALSETEEYFLVACDTTTKLSRLAEEASKRGKFWILFKTTLQFWRVRRLARAAFRRLEQERLEQLKRLTAPFRSD